MLLVAHNEIEELVVRMARENRTRGYNRIERALKHLGYTMSDQIVGNILKRHGIPPAPERKKTVTWREFIRIHMDVLGATDFFTCEVWSWLGVVDTATPVTVFPYEGLQGEMAACGQRRVGILSDAVW